MLKITQYLLLLGITVLAFSTMPALAVEQGGIGGRPANPDPDIPRSESIFVYELDEGASKNDAIIISNNSSETKTIEVYAVDAQTTNTGSFACRQKVEQRDGVGSWITLEQETVTLEPATRDTVDFLIELPDIADVGEHNGCIVLAEVDDDDADEATGGVSLSYRSALRVAVTVPGDIIKELAFADLTVAGDQREDFAKQASYILSPTLDNTGNVSLDTTITTRLTSIFGNEITNSGTFPILPRDSMSLQLRVTPSFWGGIYRASADATYNENPETGIGQGKGDDLKTITRQAGWVAVPPTSAALAIIASVLAILTTSVLYWLYRKGSLFNPIKNWRTHRVGTDENIQKIAQDYNVSWKKLARVNKLQAPYTVKPGMRLYVPAGKRKI